MAGGGASCTNILRHAELHAEPCLNVPTSKLFTMCKSLIHGFLAELPKCEHHLHLEGALSPDLLFSLAKSNGISLPADDPAFSSPETLASRYQHFSSLNDFLHYYYIGINVLVRQSDFESLALDYFKRAAKDGVVHAEVFFDPQAHLSRGVPYDTVLSGFASARNFAHAELGISSELICCFLRHLPVPQSLDTFRLDEVQNSLAAGTVIGIGLDSSETDFPPELFESVFRLARAKGFKRTAHAGEEGPAANIQKSLDILDVQRIDHGVRLVDDPSLLRRVAAQGTLLTVCPLSNVWLKGAPSVADLPIKHFLDSGVSFSINSDDPAYFGDHYILDNYCAVQEAFDLTVQDWTTICRASIRASWCSVQRQDEMITHLERVIGQWNATNST